MSTLVSNALAEISVHSHTPYADVKVTPTRSGSYPPSPPMVEVCQCNQCNGSMPHQHLSSSIPHLESSLQSPVMYHADQVATPSSYPSEHHMSPENASVYSMTPSFGNEYPQSPLMGQNQSPLMGPSPVMHDYNAYSHHAPVHQSPVQMPVAVCDCPECLSTPTQAPHMHHSHQLMMHQQGHMMQSASSYPMPAPVSIPMISYPPVSVPMSVPPMSIPMPAPFPMAAPVEVYQQTPPAPVPVNIDANRTLNFKVPPPQTGTNGKLHYTSDQFEDLKTHFKDVAKTPHGSTYLQAIMREKDQTKYQLIFQELYPHSFELMLDPHGAYALKTMMEFMNPEQVRDVLEVVRGDEAKTIQVCTSSLHSRRVVQFFLEKCDANECQFIVDLMVRRCRDIATTQQGCICMQRVLDSGTMEQRVTIFAEIQNFLIDLTLDPFGNYVVQYMLEMGDKEKNSKLVKNHILGRVTEFACNKFASNVIEKCLFFTNTEVQHACISEIYANPPQVLESMLQDSFGNYIIQTSLALANFKDVWMISEKLTPLLNRVPYGYKIEARLQRRLKGKPLSHVRIALCRPS